MAQTPPPTGKKPVAKPAGNPYANIQAAPRAAPKANLVRPTVAPPTDERRFIGLQTPVPTPNNSHFNYIPPAPYNNPFREYKTQPVETNYRPPNPKMWNAVLHGSTAQKDNGYDYARGFDRNAPAGEVAYIASGDAFDEYVRQRNQLYGNGIVSELEGFMAKQQPSREKQYLLDMIDRQRLRTTNPMVGKEALGLYPKKLMLRDPVEERPWHQGRGGAPGHMPSDRIPPSDLDYTLEEQQADLENMGYMAFVDAPYLLKDFSNPPFYVTYRDQDRLGSPRPNSSVKANYVHEASHLRGFANQKQRDEEIANYFKIITNDPLNRVAMLMGYKSGMDFGSPDYDYEASPEEMLSRIDQTRQYMKDIYGSDEFHKLTAEDAVRIWIESNRYSEGIPTNDTSMSYADLYDPDYTANMNLTPKQIRLLLQNNLQR